MISSKRRYVLSRVHKHAVTSSLHTGYKADCMVFAWRDLDLAHAKKLTGTAPGEIKANFDERLDYPKLIFKDFHAKIMVKVVTPISYSRP